MNRTKRWDSSAQFHMKINAELLRRFKKLCSSYDVSASAGMKDLVKDSLRNSQLPEIHKQKTIPNKFIRNYILKAVTITPGFVLRHIDDIVGMLYPRDTYHGNPVWPTLSETYLKILMTCEYVLSLYRAPIGISGDNMILRFLATAYIDSQIAVLSYDDRPTKKNLLGLCIFLAGHLKGRSQSQLLSLRDDLNTLSSAQAAAVSVKSLVQIRIKHFISKYDPAMTSLMLDAKTMADEVQKDDEVFTEQYLNSAGKNSDFMVEHMKDINEMVLPKSQGYDVFWSKCCQLYLNIYIMDTFAAIKALKASSVTLTLGRHFPGAPNDDYIARYLTLTWLIIKTSFGIREPDAYNWNGLCSRALKRWYKKVYLKWSSDRKSLRNMVVFDTIKLVIRPRVLGMIQYLIKQRNIGLYKMITYGIFSDQFQYVGPYTDALEHYAIDSKKR